MKSSPRVQDIVRIKDEYYIRAHSSLAQEKIHVLKAGETFAIFNQNGNIRSLGLENHGIYYEGTRFLSRMVMLINHRRLLLLSSRVKESNELLAVDLTNPDLCVDQFISKGQVHIFCLGFLKDQCYYERIRFSNYGCNALHFDFTMEFDADYHDIFEVRGLSRKKRGKLQRPVVKKNTVELSYQGLDDICRRTFLQFSLSPMRISPHQAEFSIQLKPHETKDLFFSVACESTSSKPLTVSFDQALKDVRRHHATLEHDQCRIHTSNEQFNDWLRQSSSDLFMMLTAVRGGFYPYAGIPWFSTVFGRDGIITALEVLWIYPQIAQGVLRHLADHQASALLPQQDAEPGKILHEVRRGEMANLQEIPFGKYYGSVDSTPLFLVLAGHYYDRTGDENLIKKIWPSLLSALQWVEKYGDRDGDGFVEYERKAIGGLSQQGWKDSEDSIFHRDGTLAETPIALCEVQAYVYEAKIQLAKLAQMLGESALSKRLWKEAAELKKKFLQSFWCQDIKMLAIALDGNKRPCRVLSSNAGQCLFSKIVPRSVAAKVRDHLMGEDFFSGWGVRTVAASQARFNPMSYHNGSVWPHDNALMAYGLSLYGYKEAALQIMTGLFEASLSMDLHRLPELFCGFSRRPAEGPTLYPVACNPQAWSSASVFLLLQSCLGMSMNAVEKKIHFINPLLPAYLKEVWIQNLHLGSARVDLHLQYHPGDLGINIDNRKGQVEVVIVK